MSQSPDEEKHHHLHLHFIIAHQKVHVYLCQASYQIPLLPTLHKFLYKSIRYALHRMQGEKSYPLWQGGKDLCMCESQVLWV
jgi:hypothetical protein